MEYGQIYNLQTEMDYLGDLLLNFLNALHLHLMLTLHNHAKKAYKKIARQGTEGFTHFLKIYLISATDTDLTEDQILDSLTLLSWYIHSFWKSLVRHILPVTKLIAEGYHHLIPKLLETLHYIYDTTWFHKTL